MLLVEEMRRVLRYLSWRAAWWRRQENSWDQVGYDVSDGLTAYALRQADLCDAIANGFKAKWAVTELSAVREAIAASALEGVEGTILGAPEM